MDIFILLLLIIVILLLIKNINSSTENYTQCQKKVYIDPHSLNNCYAQCSQGCQPYGNRCSDKFSVFFPS